MDDGSCPLPDGHGLHVFAVATSEGCVCSDGEGEDGAVVDISLGQLLAFVLGLFALLVLRVWGAWALRRIEFSSDDETAYHGISRTEAPEPEPEPAP